VKPGGEQFLVTVTLSEPIELAGYAVRLNFYRDLLPATGMSVETTLEGTTFTGRPCTSGEFPNRRYCLSDAGAVATKGSIASFCVSYSDDSLGEYYVTVMPVFSGRTVKPLPGRAHR